MRIAVGRAQFRGKLLLQFRTKIMLDPFGRFVQMIERQIEMFTQVSFPQPMSTNQRLRACSSRFR